MCIYTEYYIYSLFYNMKKKIHLILPFSTVEELVYYQYRYVMLLFPSMAFMIKYGKFYKPKISLAGLEREDDLMGDKIKELEVKQCRELEVMAEYHL